MKEIKLKPQLEQREKVIFKGKEYYTKICDFTHSIFFENENGETLVDENGVYVSLVNGYEIIESPDRIADDGKVFQDKHCECDRPSILICRDKTHDANCQHGICKKCSKKAKGFTPKDIISSAMKILEEKPPLKLRVGGKYMRSDGDVEEIYQTRKKGIDNIYLSKSDLLYRENGSSLSLFMGEHKDLIEEYHEDEEVQPEYAYTIGFDPIFAAAADEDEQRMIDAENELDEKFTSSVLKYPGELESLRKENAELRKTNGEFAERLIKKPEGNPFKVGDKVKVYGSPIYDEYREYFMNGDIGFIEEIQGVEVIISFVEPIKLHCPRFHYKQCELVND